MSEPGLTTNCSIKREPAGTGGYARLTTSEGEKHSLRTDCLPSREFPDGTPEDGAWESPSSEHVIRFVQMTDFQLADLASPSRLEFLQRLVGTPGWRLMLPSYRPQEFLALHAIAAIVRTVRELGGLDLALTTGDNIDSAQLNELATYLTLMDGGQVDPGAGSRGLKDTVSADIGGDFWNPEPESRDWWKTARGFPDRPGALAAAAQPFAADGVGVPWLACFGNHDQLVQGRAPVPTDIDELLKSPRKPQKVATDLPAGEAIDSYVRDPLSFVDASPASGLAESSVARRIEPNSDRRIVSRSEYVQAHLDGQGLPVGHGFSAEDVDESRAYYVHDGVPGVRMICLDTTNPAGYADGCIDDRQFRWLEERLREVHSRASGMPTGNTDRLVILFSHHGLSTLVNDTRDDANSGIVHLADEVEGMLHTFPNVVLWLSGHTHVNKVTPRPSSAVKVGDVGGFWEISTSSIAEWPVQARLLEVRCDSRFVRVRSTMIDSAIPVVPDEDNRLTQLASLHREIAANDPDGVGGPDAEGTAGDRNVELLVPLPFPR